MPHRELERMIVVLFVIGHQELAVETRPLGNINKPPSASPIHELCPEVNRSRQFLLQAQTPIEETWCLQCALIYDEQSAHRWCAQSNAITLEKKIHTLALQRPSNQIQVSRVIELSNSG